MIKTETLNLSGAPLMKQLVQSLQGANNGLPKCNIELLICCLLCLLTSCHEEGEITIYYKTGYIASPISKSFESFEKEMFDQTIDTVIYVRSEDFQRYRDVLNRIKFDEGNTDNIHDYYIGIKCEDVSLAIQQPVPDSLNEEIITYTKQGHHGKIKDEDLYNLLCAARYFDFFTEEELVEHPMARKFRAPSDYKYFWSSDAYEIPLPLKSRYKVIIRKE